VDLDDLLEDLLDGAADVARRRARRVRQQAARRTAVLRRRLRRLARAAGAAVAAIFGALTLALALAGTPGGVRLAGAALTALLAVVAGGVALAAHRAERRDPRSRASRARRRRGAGRRAGRPVQAGRAGQTGRAGTGPFLDDEVAAGVPRDVAADWDRLLQARRLVQDLAHDGCVEGTSLLEVDGLVLRLHRLLVADERTRQLGGRPSPALRQQVGELADLLVALADEAVELQVQQVTATTSVPVTLADARDHLLALRDARRELDGHQI
jgi:hypothetical protein